MSFLGGGMVAAILVQFLSATVVRNGTELNINWQHFRLCLSGIRSNPNKDRKLVFGEERKVAKMPIVRIAENRARYGRNLKQIANSVGMARH